MRVTQKAIAEALNLSLITVQRAFNDSGYVSKEVKDRIFAHAKAMHYVPHKASQVLKRNRTRRLALISSTDPAYFWADIRTGIEAAAEQIAPFDYTVNYVQVPESDSGRFLDVVAELAAGGADGIAFVNKWPQAVGEAVRVLEARTVPYVTFNVDAPGTRRVCHIGPDYRAGGRLAAEYLGKALFFREDPVVLVIGTQVQPGDGEGNLDTLRLQGFTEVLSESFPGVRSDVRRLPADLDEAEAQAVLDDLAHSLPALPAAIYLTAPYNPAFIRAFERHNQDQYFSILHDLDKVSFPYLASHRLMATICQNPLLQGYDTVRVLEQLLEGGRPADVEVVHSLVFNANKEHYANGRLGPGPFSPL